ncbi:MAG: nickel insertion protein, partial [Gammaproteobacteria bacterium]
MAERLLVIRTPSGLSGDMLVCGLARVAGTDDAELDGIVEGLGIPALRGTLRVRPHSVQSIAGWRAFVALPEAHAHRSAADILALNAASALGERAQALAAETFRLLARIEGGIHGIAPDQVEFHEI